METKAIIFYIFLGLSLIGLWFSSYFNRIKIDELNNRIEVLEEYVLTTSTIHKYEVEEIFADIECIEQNLNYLFNVGDFCEESFPDKDKK